MPISRLFLRCLFPACNYCIAYISSPNAPGCNILFVTLFIRTAGTARKYHTPYGAPASRHGDNCCLPIAHMARYRPRGDT